jgi:hypothetical protein
MNEWPPDVGGDINDALSGRLYAVEVKESSLMWSSEAKF